MSLTSHNFAAEMRAQIARNQLTLGELADELSLSTRQVSRLVNGESKWSLDNALKAASWAGLSITDFLGGAK